MDYSCEISIIVPVYNGEKTIERCVNSLLSQTLQSFEIIIVNDGSTDYTKSVIERLAEEDKRIRVVNQINSGVSVARNKGINAANGKYLMFCDSDDYVAPEWCEVLYNAIKEQPDAWVCCDTYFLDEYGEVVSNPVITKTDAITYYDIFVNRNSPYCWNKIFKCDTIRQNGIFFDEAMGVSEDVKFTIDYLNQCDKVQYINRKLYYYTYNENSIMHTYNNNSFDNYIFSYSYRLPHIEAERIGEYNAFWANIFYASLSHIFSKDNTESLVTKLKRNNIYMKNNFFRCCLKNAEKTKIPTFEKLIILHGNYYMLWTLQIIKGKLNSVRMKMHKVHNGG